MVNQRPRLGSLLPEDLIIDIFLRLPVKSLLRLQSVCKRWHAIITSSCFVNRHLLQQSNKTNLLVCWRGVVYEDHRCTGKYVFALTLLSGKTLENHVELDTRIFTGAIYCVCGPCNGIICVQFSDSSFALWNPASRKLWPIPCYLATSSASDKLRLWVDRFTNKPIPRYSPNSPTSVIFSFWIDPLTRDYKIFMIISETGLNMKYQKPRFVLYNSFHDSWISFKEEESPFGRDDIVPISQCRRYSVSDGYYYFFKENKITSSYTLMAFDIHNEIFEEIKMPDTIDKTSSNSLSLDLDLYGGLLALFVCKIESADRQCCEIWVMKKKGCWTKLCFVELPGIDVYLMGFWGSTGQIICSQNFSGKIELMIYSPLSNEERKVEIVKIDTLDGTYEYAYRCDVIPLSYAESLIAFKR